MWKKKNILESDRTQMALWRMHVACWIQKTTDTYSECVMLIALPLQEWLQERALPFGPGAGHLHFSTTFT